MNDLITKSFLSYVELKKHAMKDQETEADLEMGQLDPTNEQNLSLFFQEVAPIKSDMEDITNLLLDLQDLNESTKSTHSAKILKGIRERIDSDMVSILQKAKNIKSRLESLHQSNLANRKSYKEITPVDRTRISVTNGLRVKLREMMHDFQSLREQIVKEHIEGLKRRYYSITGEEPSEEVIEKMMISGSGLQEKLFEGKVDLAMENKERHEALKDIQRSLTKLHQVFLDMAVLVDTQGEEIKTIEENVNHAKASINGGTNGLFYAKQMEKRRNWACWIGVLVLILLVCLVAILA
ncbi:putative syntaxin [Tripterygium wilfordii]|uniref:Putative syntaxin n=2 Tax=Tripterygium wilfordii TaxID=458696 RepID=A0A7J7DH65_TRIWF|nr:putative syntaxin [Tripterygium wilfordii]